MSDAARSPLPIAAEAWDRFRGSLLRYLAGRLPTSDDAEDVLQDVFLRLHESERAGRPERAHRGVSNGVAPAPRRTTSQR